MVFEWDTRKSATNLRKHGVSFTEASTVTVLDPDHSVLEDRYITTGWSNLHRLLMVAHSNRGEKIRIISARELTKAERKEYEEAN